MLRHSFLRNEGGTTRRVGERGRLAAGRREQGEAGDKEPARPVCKPEEESGGDGMQAPPNPWGLG